MPSHHTSPSGVRATLVKMESFATTRHGIGVGLVGGARRHAEEARFGIDGVEFAIRTGLDPGNIIAHGGDLVVAQGVGRDHHGEVGLAAGAGEGRGDIGLFAIGRGDAEYQHVFGEPAFVPGHAGGDAQGEALLAEQGIAAVATAVGPDAPLLGKWTMYFSSLLHGQGTSFWPPVSGMPTEWMQGTNSLYLPRASTTARPTRVMMCMFTTT